MSFLRVTHTLSPPMASTLKAFWHSPVGPKTVHFWGPAANWGLVLAAMIDMSKPADTISLKVCAYGNNSSALKRTVVRGWRCIESSRRYCKG